MTATMIKMDNGYFIPKIDGFESDAELLEVNIDIIDDSYKNIYKEQLRDAVCEHEEKLTDEYIKENWRDLIMTTKSNPDYYKSEQYYEDRAEDYRQRGKI